MKQWKQEMRVNGDDEDENDVKGDDDDAFGMQWIESWVTIYSLTFNSQLVHIK